MQVGIFRRKFGVIVITIILITLLSVITYVGISSLFRIQSIIVVGSQVHVIVDEKKLSKNLLFFPSQQLREKILKDNVLLSDVEFYKQFPHTLVIKPVVRRPFVRLVTQNRTVLLDSSGMIILDGDQGYTMLPLMRFEIQNLHIGSKITDARVLMCLDFVNQVHTFMPVDDITEVDSKSARIKSGQIDILITQDKPIAETLATLQTLMAGFRIKSKLPTVVDLRFDKPVVQF